MLSCPQVSLHAARDGNLWSIVRRKMREARVRNGRIFFVSYYMLVHITYVKTLRLLPTFGWHFGTQTSGLTLGRVGHTSSGVRHSVHLGLASPVPPETWLVHECTSA